MSPWFSLVLNVPPPSGNLLDSIVQTFGVDWSAIAAQAVNFGIVTLILWKFAFSPLMKVINARQKEIQDALQYAEDSKVRLAEAERQSTEKLKRATEEATVIVRQARENATTLLEDQKHQALLQSRNIVEKARESTREEHTQLLREAKRDVARLVAELSVKVLEKELKEGEKERFALAASREI